MHVGFLLLGFGLVGNLIAKTQRGQIFFWALGVLGFSTGLYNWVEYNDLIRRTGFLTQMDLVMGIILVVLVFEGALAFAAGGALIVAMPLSLATADFTLDWHHSVEHALWWERWQITDAGLAPVAARITASGAGMGG
jgi:TRAP-type uncharacterized transport system fused permease subunit